MKKLTIIAVMTLLAGWPISGNNSATAQLLQSARNLGMADSYLYLSGNCEAAALNPASLSSPENHQISVKLLSASAHFANNAFSLADYNRYNGEYLTETDKEEILSKIPDNGLIFDFDATASVLSFSYQSFAFTAAGIGGGRGSVAKDPIELALMGNKIGEVQTGSDSYADNWAALSLGVSYGRSLFEINGFHASGGVSIRYLQGFEYYGVTELAAEAVTLQTGFTGEGGLTTLEAHGGSGYAVDFGVNLSRESTQCGLVVRNAFANLNWNTDVKKTLYNFRFENVNVENADNDSISVSDEIDLPADEFSTRPPLEVELGVSQKFGKLLGSASLRQGFDETAFVSKTPRLAAGIEYPLIPAFALRSGLAVGGIDEYSGAVGGGFSLGVVKVDLAYASTGTLLPFGGRGARLAFSTILEF